MTCMFLLKSTSHYILYHLNSIGSNLDLLSESYENIFLMGDFICDMENADLKEFCKLL